MHVRGVIRPSMLAILFATTAQAQPPKGVSAAPQAMLVFYGWPSTINGAGGNVKQAATEFARYDIVVLGGGLESPEHTDHRNTKAIIAAAAKTRFYGYVPLGNRAGQDKCLPNMEIAQRIDLISKMGAKGVLLDEFGYDYNVSRVRQNAAVNAAHAKKLAVIANAWNPDHVFLPDDAAVPPALTMGDAYLWESYRFKMGVPVDLKEWRDKADKVAAGKQKLALAVYSLSTNKVISNGDVNLYKHQWYSAAIDGHEATGWGYPDFAANSKAPWMAPPDKAKAPIVIGNHVGNAVQVVGKTVSIATNKGIVEVDVEKLSATFTPKKGGK